jgi:hypothetical protein
MLTDAILDIFAKHNLWVGRLISYSKVAPQEHQVIWNANITIENRGKIWYGDISLVKDRDNLQAVANELDETLYVLKENDCWEFNKEYSLDEMKHNAVCEVRPK